MKKLYEKIKQRVRFVQNGVLAGRQVCYLCACLICVIIFTHDMEATESQAQLQAQVKKTEAQLAQYKEKMAQLEENMRNIPPSVFHRDKNTSPGEGSREKTSSKNDSSIQSESESKSPASRKDKRRGERDSGSKSKTKPWKKPRNETKTESKYSKSGDSASTTIYAPSRAALLFCCDKSSEHYGSYARLEDPEDVRDLRDQLQHSKSRPYCTKYGVDEYLVETGDGLDWVICFYNPRSQKQVQWVEAGLAEKFAQPRFDAGEDVL